MTETINRRRKKECGAFFTPLWISSELIRTHQIHRHWAEGASVLDPTAGDGSLLEALIRCCVEDNIPVTSAMMKALKGYEKEADFCGGFKLRIEERYGIKADDETLECRDFLKVESGVYDILLGNPPWLNFTDVKEEDKEELKEFFLRYELTEKGKGLLLGAARIDLAALMIKKAVQDHLTPGGRGYFFIPLSLMLNEGAHNIFRKGELRRRDNHSRAECFSFTEIRDFAETQVFPEVNTRCGFIALTRRGKQKRSIPYYTLLEPGRWREEEAHTVGPAGSAYMIGGGEGRPALISIRKASRPRQGINTGGRNSLFIFDSCREAGKGLCRVRNKNSEALLPEALIFPLLSRRQFRGDRNPSKFIFLPYNSAQGKVLTPRELQEYPAAQEYLEQHKESLAGRKGALLGNSINKGLYWSLLGVGPYTFAPWKIVWEAYGRDEFEPLLFGTCSLFSGEKPWIPNQALQASCSFDTEGEGLRVLEGLKQPSINRILKQQKMEGTCNWAQPGRIRHFLKETDETEKNWLFQEFF